MAAYLDPYPRQTELAPILPDKNPFLAPTVKQDLPNKSPFLTKAIPQPRKTVTGAPTLSARGKVRVTK
jgi:hypothetical protein